MIRIKHVCLFTIVFLTFSSCKEQYIISGKVTDFSGSPLDSVTVRLKNRAFNDLYETRSDSAGNYTLKVKKGNYYCLYAIKLSDYRVTRLEYWAWNVPVYGNLVINPQYDKMEIYGVNVFEPQVTPQETYMIYFRPMSLFKGIQLMEAQKVDKKAYEQAKRTEELLNEDKIVDISPATITAGELSVEINGTKARIVGINKISEYGRGKIMYGYMVQVVKPGNNEKSKYDRISITLHSAETGETGKSEAFIKK
ncbi:carboxypeptidase-like regulatory domain-containing protein [Filimonas effusa]|uniref:Carboxypeptidase regulatory-like domain-containing protein n=1 Tax=Filimonas effusa TaxID=2508721 RepID=A0A4Q1DBE9_9BACT|nr:carboxypeptidase-like regulatory domain-containing protein [Filimonas effusa]RXK86784.1 carboxypeptidase regulatory-like domain-containing protein [Filimonas effusa]